MKIQFRARVAEVRPEKTHPGRSRVSLLNDSEDPNVDLRYVASADAEELAKFYGRHAIRITIESVEDDAS